MQDSLRLLACSIRLPDLERARDFYAGALGFAAKAIATDWIVLPGRLPVFLERVPAGPVPAVDQARTLLMLKVHDLRQTAERFRRMNIPLVTGVRNTLSIGVVDCFRDPFGNVHSLVELSDPPAETWSEPDIYNVGIRLPIAAVPEARRIYSDALGFSVRTDRYYPPALPMMNPGGSFAFMIYDKPSFLSDFRAKAPLYPAENGCLLVFQSRDVDAFRASLRARAPRLRMTDVQDFAFGRRMAIIDNAGIASEVWELSRPI